MKLLKTQKFFCGCAELALKFCTKCVEKNAETLTRTVLKRRWCYVRNWTEDALEFKIFCNQCTSYKKTRWNDADIWFNRLHVNNKLRHNSKVPQKFPQTALKPKNLSANIKV